MGCKKMVWEEIDGTDPNNKEKRSELFRISGLRAEYPQVFFLDRDSCEYRFVGNYGKISTLNENNGILKENPEILESNPHLADQVFDKVFEKVLVVDRDMLESPCTGTLTRLQLQQEQSTMAEPQLTGEESLESSCAETLQAQSQQRQQEDTKAEPQEQPQHLNPFTFGAGTLMQSQLQQQDITMAEPQVAREELLETSCAETLQAESHQQEQQQEDTKAEPQPMQSQPQQQEITMAEPQVAGEDLLESSCAETLQAESQQEEQQQQQEDTKAERQPEHPFTFQLKPEQLPEDENMVFEPSTEIAPERAAEPSAEHQGSSVRIGEKRKREEEQQEKEDQEEHVQEEKHQQKSSDEPQHLRKRDRIKRRLRGIFNALFSSSA